MRTRPNKTTIEIEYHAVVESIRTKILTLINDHLTARPIACDTTVHSTIA